MPPRGRSPRSRDKHQAPKFARRAGRSPARPLAGPAQDRIDVPNRCAEQGFRRQRQERGGRPRGRRPARCGGRPGPSRRRPREAGRHRVELGGSRQSRRSRLPVRSHRRGPGRSVDDDGPAAWRGCGSIADQMPAGPNLAGERQSVPERIRHVSTGSVASGSGALLFHAHQALEHQVLAKLSRRVSTGSSRN
jgi:hypothetical protein